MGVLSSLSNNQNAAPDPGLRVELSTCTDPNTIWKAVNDHLVKQGSFFAIMEAMYTILSDIQQIELLLQRDHDTFRSNNIQSILATQKQLFPVCFDAKSVEHYATHLRNQLLPQLHLLRPQTPPLSRTIDRLASHAPALAKLSKESLVSNRFAVVKTSLQQPLQQYIDCNIIAKHGNKGQQSFECDGRPECHGSTPTTRARHKSTEQRIHTLATPHGVSKRYNSAPLAPYDATKENHTSSQWDINKLTQELKMAQSSPMVIRYSHLVEESNQLAHVAAALIRPYVKLALELKSNRATVTDLSPEEQPHFALAVDKMSSLYTANPETFDVELLKLLADNESSKFAVTKFLVAVHWLHEIVQQPGRIVDASGPALAFETTEHRALNLQGVKLQQAILDSASEKTHNFTDDGVDDELFLAVFRDWRIRYDELTDLQNNSMYKQSIQQTSILEKKLAAHAQREREISADKRKEEIRHHEQTRQFYALSHKLQQMLLKELGVSVCVT